MRNVSRDMAEVAQDLMPDVWQTVTSSTTSTSAAADAITALITDMLTACAPRMQPGSPRGHSVFRTFRGGGGHLPPDLVAALQRSRQLQRACLRTEPGSVERAAAAAEADAFRRRVRRLTRKFHGRVLRQRDAELERLRAPNPHRLHSLLRAATGPDPAVFTDGRQSFPDEPGQLPAVLRFHQHFLNLFTDDRAMPCGATSEEWLQYVPTCSSGAGAALARPFEWQEVYMVLFPATRGAPA
jgi:hypothetical protein